MSGNLLELTRPETVLTRLKDILKHEPESPEFDFLVEKLKGMMTGFQTYVGFCTREDYDKGLEFDLTNILLTKGVYLDWQPDPNTGVTGIASLVAYHHKMKTEKTVSSWENLEARR